MSTLYQKYMFLHEEPRRCRHCLSFISNTFFSDKIQQWKPYSKVKFLDSEVSQKAQKNTVKSSVFFALLGSLLVIAARKMLLKSTQGLHAPVRVPEVKKYCFKWRHQFVPGQRDGVGVTTCWTLSSAPDALTWPSRSSDTSTHNHSSQHLWFEH